MSSGTALLGELESMLFSQAGGGPTPAGAHVRVHPPSHDTKDFVVKPFSLDAKSVTVYTVVHGNQGNHGCGMHVREMQSCLDSAVEAAAVCAVQESVLGQRDRNGKGEQDYAT